MPMFSDERHVCKYTDTQVVHEDRQYYDIVRPIPRYNGPYDKVTFNQNEMNNDPVNRQ